MNKVKITKYYPGQLQRDGRRARHARIAEVGKMISVISQPFRLFS